jgi:LPXTG-motif cell wall-anchored protein
MRTPILTAAFAGVLALATFGVGGARAASGDLYDSIPSPQPSNLPSLGYQATQTAEFGDDIAFAPGSRALHSVNVYMSSWACENWATAGALCATTPGSTFTHPITLNFYAVAHDAGTGAPVLGAKFKSITTTFTMPYRPSADTTCPNGTGWKNAAGACFNGFGFVISFDLAGFVVPDEMVYGIAYNTNTWGANPLGTNGPFESLNVGLAPNSGAGTDVNPDLVFWNTATAASYADNGAAGVGTFRADTGWASTGTVAAQFIPVAEVAATTTQPATTTVPATTIAPTTTAIGQGGPVPTTAVTTTVAPTTSAVMSDPGVLPATGSSESSALLVGVLFVVGGLAIVMIGRRSTRS